MSTGIKVLLALIAFWLVGVGLLLVFPTPYLMIWLPLLSLIIGCALGGVSLILLIKGKGKPWPSFVFVVILLLTITLVGQGERLGARAYLYYNASNFENIVARLRTAVTDEEMKKICGRTCSTDQDNHYKQFGALYTEPNHSHVLFPYTENGGLSWKDIVYAPTEPLAVADRVEFRMLGLRFMFECEALKPNWYLCNSSLYFP